MVYDEADRRVRGLWIRNGTYSAQLRVAGKTKQITLHDCKTVADARSEMQAIKRQIKKGTYQQAGAKQEVPTTGPAVPLSTAGLVLTDHSMSAAIAGYREQRDTVDAGDQKTRQRENSGLNAWKKYFCYRQTLTPPASNDVVDFDSQTLVEYSVWRMVGAPPREESLPAKDDEIAARSKKPGGRCIDLDVLAIGKVYDWAVAKKWVARQDLAWKKLAKAPKEVRLLTEDELDAFAAGSLPTAEEIEKGRLKKDGTKMNQDRNMALRMAAAKAFEDFIYLIFYSGAREFETRWQRWTNVTWSRILDRDEGEFEKGEKVRGHIHFPGKLAKKGAGKPAEDRNVDFYDKLETHLLDMYDRRNPATDLMFPSDYNVKVPQGSFRKRQLQRARDVTGQQDVAFHHGRHYFISYAVMRGVDYKTIALWVSHRDGGVLIGNKYSHLAPGHSKKLAAKMD
jgi:hypothetical protein